MIDPAYRAQVDLLLRILPYVAEEECFALKGGTAINLFVRDMPRLSVDIDLTYLPISNRESSLAAITQALLRLKERITKAIAGSSVQATGLKGQMASLPHSLAITVRCMKC